MTARPDFDIQEELKKLPARPGVYLMHDESDGILYVGKAVRLKNRVKQYFDASRSKSAKIMKMVSKIAWFEYIVTDTELEALVLECNLIKEYRPPYNTMLMDDKGYPYICVTAGEMYPRVFQTRTVRKDKSRYFGPYTSGYAVKQSLELFQKLFHFRTCSRVFPRDIGKERPCLNLHMGRCLGPCTGEVSAESYRENIDRIVRFLDGDSKEIQKNLREQMKEASLREEYEEAMRCRDLLRALEHLQGQQKITDLESSEDRDFIAAVTAEELRAERAAEEAEDTGAGPDTADAEAVFAPDEQTAIVSVFFVRQGKLIGREHYHLKVPAGEEKGEILGSFVRQYYTGTAEIPKEIFLETEIPDDRLTAEFLSGRKGQKVSLFVPKKGEKEHFMELAKRNARIMLDREEGRFEAREARDREAVRELEALTGLQGLKRMEAFDISNISGFESVGSMVVFVDGAARKNSYRKFRIRTVSGPDDYASMAEVLGRRFAKKHRAPDTEAGDTFAPDLPDIILMDGGKGQVHVAEEILAREGLSIPVAGMVKDDRHRTRGLYFHDEELPIDTHGEAFRLITRIQDEAHRFAITYHRGLHTKGSISSVLSEIPGIGPKRENELIRRFEDIDALRKATEEEIAALPGFNRKTAEEVVRFLREGQKTESLESAQAQTEEEKNDG